MECPLADSTWKAVAYTSWFAHGTAHVTSHGLYTTVVQYSSNIHFVYHGMGPWMVSSHGIFHGGYPMGPSMGQTVAYPMEHAVYPRHIPRKTKHRGVPHGIIVYQGIMVFRGASMGCSHGVRHGTHCIPWHAPCKIPWDMAFPWDSPRSPMQYHGACHGLP